MRATILLFGLADVSYGLGGCVLVPWTVGVSGSSDL